VSAPRSPMLHLDEVVPLDDSPATYIDYSVVNSVMSGVLVGIAAAWAMVVFNRLWQRSLQTEASGAIEAARERGFKVQTEGLRARVVADGAVGSEPVRVEWRGGWRGPHTVLVRGDTFERTALVTDAAGLDALVHPGA